MSALNLRNVKRDFSELNYRPDVCHPDLIDELLTVLDITGLRQQYGKTVAAGNLDSRSLINIIKHVCTVSYSDSNNRDSIVGLLTFLAKIYTEYCADEAVKRTVAKCLKSCPEKLRPELCAAISRQFILILEREHDLGETEYFLKALNECCENFPNSITECVEKVMEFFQLNLRKSYDILVRENTPAQRISAIRCIHEGFRFFLTGYRKNVFPNTLNFSVTLNECFMDLLDCDHLPMETLFNCCLSMVYSQMNDMPALECWKMCLNKISTRSDLVKLGFCVAILNRYTSEELSIIEPDNGKSICVNLYNVIMETSNRNLNDSSILLSSSRVLFVLSKRLCTNKDIYLEKHQLECFISFLWTRMDHFLDGVRHLARDTMINMVKIKDEYILNEILERLSVCDTNSKAFFIVLTTLSDKVDSESIIKYLPNIAENLIDLLSSNNSAINIFINLMLNYHSTAESKLWFDYWLRPLFRNSDKLDVKHFERIITKAVELDPDVLKHVHDLSIQNEFSLKIYLILFNIQKQSYLANNDNGEWINQTTYETLKIALHNNDENIRYIAVNLILDSKKKTQTFSNMELELMKYFITYNIKEDNASVKQNNLSFVKKLLLRMRESQLSVTVRNNTTLNSTVTKHYSEFQRWLSEFCFQNLFRDANYSRRNFSLESLRLLQTCLSPTGIIGLNQSKNISLLLNCIWDTFEQNKILSKDILTYKNQEPIKVESNAIMFMLEKSRILVSSTSPPDCVTAGYLMEVVIFFIRNTNNELYILSILMNLTNDLKKEVDVAEQSLILASGVGPMYGLIHAIRHILNTLDWQTINLKNWITFIENLSTVCLKCEKVVSVVVNDSSPEGIIPMDDVTQDNCSVTSQMILLCCWRTTKESSLLLGDIVGIIATQETEFSNDLIKKICSCLTLLLSETKHRGAFEQIYVAYLKVCSTMWKSPTLHKVPLQYLEDVLTEIKTGLGEMFCVTRRSAGMPFIIQALICTNHDKRKIVNYTMETLITLCENKNITEDLEIGVVHALNVLRALFRCTQLGDLVGPFVSRAINISIILFNSSSWPIRNSSTLLLSALVNRVFGAPRSSTEISWKNRMTGREFFQRYPELYDTFLKEFQKFSPMDMRPSLYPTLLILARLYPSVNENTDSIYRLATYIPYIFKCAQSPVMKTRMLAATSIAPQVTQNKLVEHLNITCHELLKKDLKENTIHGLLLQMFSLVQDLPKLLSDDLNRLVILTEDLLLEHEHFINHSYVVQEVFLRCITCLWLQLDDLQYNSIRQLYTLILKSVSKSIQPHAIGQSKYLESAVFFLFSVSVKARKDFSTALYSIMKNETNCRTVFDILNFILSEMPIEYCDHLEKLKSINYWDRKVLLDQLISNKSLIELVCQHCCIKNGSFMDIKFLVLSNFTAALLKYFEKYEILHIFIKSLCLIKIDTAIANGVLCIKEYLKYSKSLDKKVVKSIVQLVDDVYDNNRSDACKIACIDLIVDNYNLLINYFGDFEVSKDVFRFFKIWNIIIHYSEDDSEEVRNHVWRLVNKDTNHTKSFELLFGKFSEHFNVIPSAVLMALIYWSYLDIELPQYRKEGQVFDGGDTSAFKEHSIRQKLALETAVYLANGKPQSTGLETISCIKHFIIEEWLLINTDVAQKVIQIKTVEDFMKYAKEFYSETIVPWNISPGFTPINTRNICR